MRKITLINTFLLICFIISCQNIDVNKQIKENYKKSILFFDSSLVDHLPSNLCDSCGYSTTVPKKDTLKMFGFGVDYIYLWKKYNQSKYSEKSYYYKSLSKTEYTPTDSNLLLVFSYTDVIEVKGRKFRDQETSERQALAKHNINTANSFPIPLFDIDIYKGNTISGLPEYFKIYVLDAMPGKYIEEKYLQECECLPKDWKHGYSKGVALSDEKRVIIYWLIVW